MKEVIAPSFVVDHIKEPASFNIELPTKEPSSFVTEVLPPPVKSPICIFLTGATGFLGKVVLEELLRRRSEYSLTRIYLLIRSKGEHNAQARFQHKIASSPCFSALPPDWLDVVDVIEGDDTLLQCGIAPAIYEYITQHITHVIHCAGCVSFELPVLEAVAANIDGTMDVYDLAKASSNLVQLVTTSTAYVAPHTNLPINETLLKLPYPAQDLVDGIRIGKWSESEVLEMTGHPNTYTLTKCLAEHLLIERQEIPVTIIRPSIISASMKYPSPGWIDSAAAFAGLLVGLGAGVLHVLDGSPNAQVDIVPVDLVATKIINEALFPKITTNTNTASLIPPSRIVFAVSTLKRSIRAGSIITTAVGFFRERKAKSLGRFYFGPRGMLYHIFDFVDHTVPYTLAGYYFWATGNQKKMRMTGRVSVLVKMLQRVFSYFTNRTFNFVAEGGGLFDEFEVVDGSLQLGEKEEWDGLEYVKLVCLGVDVHLLSKMEKDKE